MPADGYASERRIGRPATAGEIERLIRLYSQSLQYTVEVPGTHYSGLTYNHLLAILADQGKDFAANTATLRRHTATVCRLVFDGATRVPSAAEVERVVKTATLDWILKRFRYEVRDERIRLNTNAYQRAKRRYGFMGPVGVRTGALIAAVAQGGRIVIR